ncbi:MAG: ATP-binding cassette domain-containing protein [uncultured Aureispira sp.]|uniref:ATP-binding cassette domain-containing protein n=1 Tax=uncultured Aureispira sp. TaxID=1331704 RepID=A0A6S6U7R6_9BACT|nr:MAG: ATP-binding cassette domain-containing protein [uncultured Aureispira sp.]
MLLHLDLQKKLDRTEGSRELKVQMELDAGDFVAIYGPSGIGKTTLLRIIAGLSQADTGFLSINKSCWFDEEKNINVSPQKRKVGFVFQDYALFPNMTILENLHFANSNAALIQKLLKQTNLEGLKHKKPAELSGGQQQRVALARALVVESPILLLDEPLSALDHSLRQDMQDLIAELHQTYQRTTLMVSHDIPEIINLANKLLVIKDRDTILYDQPKAYFERENLLDEIEETGLILAIDDKELLLQIGAKKRRLPYSKETLGAIQVGTKISLKRWVLPSKIHEIERQ